MPISKDIDSQNVHPIQNGLVANDGSATLQPPPLRAMSLDSRLAKAHGLAVKGQYVEAIRALPADSRDPETKNTIAVCLMRLGQFEQAIPLLRAIALNNALQTTNGRVPQHIRMNYASALFFGGQPAGGLEVLAEVNSPDDPSVWLIRDSAKEWISQMSFLRKIDWMLNRIAPKNRPVPVRTPVGQFIWELA